VPVAKAYGVPSARCTSLIRKGLEVEAKAAELDLATDFAQARFFHEQAKKSIDEAIDLCPEGHPDKEALVEFAQGLAFRIVHLSNDFGAEAPEPLEDHVTLPELIMDLEPQEDEKKEVAPQDDVAQLLAQSGVSGASVPLDSKGWKTLEALGNPQETVVFVDRVLAGLRRQRSAAANAEVICAALQGISDYDELAKVILRQPWAEFVVDMRDRLDAATKFREEGIELEKQGEAQLALQMYVKAEALFKFVASHDARAKNSQKIKDALNQRAEELATKIASMQ